MLGSGKKQKVDIRDQTRLFFLYQQIKLFIVFILKEIVVSTHDELLILTTVRGRGQKVCRYSRNILQRVLGLAQGLLLDGHALKTSTERHPGCILTRCASHPSGSSQCGGAAALLRAPH